MVVFVQGSNKEIYQGAEITLPNTVPVLTLSQPNGGEIWEAGSTQSIIWQSQYMSGNVRIQYSTDGGVAWQTVAQTVANTGQYQWRLPDTISGRCRVQVSEMDGAPGDVSSGTFGIYWPGDVNGDSFIDTQDMLLLADCLADVLTAPLEIDLNEDGVVNSVDLLILYYELAG
jgi:hypothetical protein